tara:strand:- start:23792 stop:24901 length:1110 start_codon:yes stop_codon:yes gene_type:complete
VHDVIRPITAAVIEGSWAPAVVPPPYDALTSEQRTQHLEQHPHSFLHVTRSADASHEHPSEHLRLATEGNAALNELISAGAYTEQHKECLFLQKIDAEGVTQRSIIGAINLAEVDPRPHEAVHPGRVQALAAHFRQVRSMSSPVVVTSRSDDLDLRLLEESDATELVTTFTATDGTQISLWEINSHLETEFEVLYIIDGHHRIAAAREANFDEVLVAYVPPSELCIGSFDRDIDEIEFLPRKTIDGLSKWCDVRGSSESESTKPADKGVLRLRFGDDWFWAERKEPSGLDSEFVHSIVLPELFGIHEADDPRLSYHPSGAGTISTPATIRLAPAELEDVFDIADADLVMPPKSTYFFPKARSGVLIISC